MKKLMIAVAVVACAIVANAANFHWGVSDYNYMDTGGHAPMQSYVDHTIGVYLASDFANFDGSAASLAALTALSGPIGYSTAYGPEAVAYTGVYIPEQFFSSGDDSVNSLDVVFVDIDGAQAGYSTMAATLTGTPPTSSDKSPYILDPATAESAFGLSYTAFSTPTPPGPGPDDPTEGVPEPTSGLLMLVGLAGLALKRRHA